MMNSRILLAAAVAAVLAGCASTLPTPSALSVADTLAAQPQLSTLNSLVAKAGMTDTLKSGGPFTVFAPTNEAFAKLPAKTMDELGKDPAKLKALLSYHVVVGKLMAADVKNGDSKTVHGANLALSRAGDYVTVEQALVQKADLNASNGVVHTVDGVLIPPAATR